MFLFKSEIAGTTFKLIILPGQEPRIDKTLDSLDQLGTIKGSMENISQFPIGTTFVAHNLSVEAGVSTITGTIRPLFFKDNIYALGVDKPTEDEVNYMLDYMVSHQDTYGCETARYFARQFEVYGYKVKIDESKCKETAKEPEVVVTPEGVREKPKYANLKEQITKEYPCPSESKTGFYIDKDVWYLLVRNMLRGENTLLFGPTGSGKTELMTHLCRVMKRNLFIQDMGTVQDAQSALLGVHRLNKDGHSEFDYAPLAHNIQKPGASLLDELNRAPLSANNILFPCLDSRRYLPIDIAGGADVRNIPVHAEHVFFATANLGSEYSGTQQIDRALLDRFFPVELDYPKEGVETKILMLRTGVDEKIAKAIVKVSADIRKQFREQELSNTISVRHTLQAGSLISDGFDLSTALTKVILPLFDDTNGASERAKIKTIIAAH